VNGGGLRELVKKGKFIVIASLDSKVERTTRIYVRGILDGASARLRRRFLLGFAQLFEAPLFLLAPAGSHIGLAFCNQEGMEHGRGILVAHIHVILMWLRLQIW